MAKAKKNEPKPRGRPVEKPLPEPIPDTPENVMRAILDMGPVKAGDWDYLKKDE